MLPSDFTHNTHEESTSNNNAAQRPSFSAFCFSTTPEPPEHDVSRNQSTTAYSTIGLNSSQWLPTPEPSSPAEDKPRSDSTTLCSLPYQSVKIQKEPMVTEQMVAEDDVVQTPPFRSFAQNVGSMVFDLIVAIASLYFVAFAALAYLWNGTPSSDPRSPALLAAAQIGPTIFPIIFALVIARLLKAVATWKLERATTVGLLESFMESRSFASSFMAPFTLKAVNITMPILMLLWTLSPAGGQSALRIVALGPLYESGLTTLHYLDTRNSAPGLLSNASGSQSLRGVNAAFNAALMSPSTSKNGTQDIFGNLQIPILDAMTQSSVPGSDGWYNTSFMENTTYASILGIPIGGLPSDANTTFNVETSYLSLACTASLKPATSSSSIFPNDPSRGYVTNGQTLGIYIDPGHEASSTQPRRIVFNSIANTSIAPKVTDASCNLTTTYVEASVFCNTTGACSVQAIRKSLLENPSSSTFGDMGLSNNDVALKFFAAFVNATTMASGEEASNSPIESYFVNPASPFPLTTEPPVLADVGNELFSIRFAQLLNAYWLASLAPTALMGGFSAAEQTYTTASTSATTTSANDVLRCHMPWLIVLVIASGIMFVAGCVTAGLDAVRKTPDVLDDVKSTLRGSPFVQVVYGSNVENTGAVVRIGDSRSHHQVSMKTSRGWKEVA